MPSWWNVIHLAFARWSNHVREEPAELQLTRLPKGGEPYVSMTLLAASFQSPAGALSMPKEAWYSAAGG